MRHRGVVFIDDDSMTQKEVAKLEAEGFLVVTKKFGRNPEIVFYPPAPPAFLNPKNEED